MGMVVPSGVSWRGKAPANRRMSVVLPVSVRPSSAMHWGSFARDTRQLLAALDLGIQLFEKRVKNEDGMRLFQRGDWFIHCGGCAAGGSHIHIGSHPANR